MVREKIAKYIKDNGIKQNYVANGIGLSPAAVSSMVNGERDLDVEEYVKICDLFKVSYDYFMPTDSKPA
ncbi:MAG: helix-turn-helix domain-containing protein [Acutalibacteraceae bacterium]